MTKSESCDRCRQAVLSTYTNLRARGVSDEDAWTSARIVFRAYHPEASWADATNVTANFIADLVER